MTQSPIDFEIPVTAQSAHMDKKTKETYFADIQALLKEKNAVLVSHYYTYALVQEITEKIGGFIGDSLEMARFGARTDADLIVVAGVRFMGETAKILAPHKTVVMPTLEATCSLDLGCPVKEFTEFCAQHPDREVVVYANTSAEVKAVADWVVTSSIAVELIDHLDSLGKKIIWGPDKHLGDYVQKQTGADMLLWDASCIVHEEFKAKGIMDMMAMYPDAAVLVHPESPESVVAVADVVGSTTQLIKASQNLPNQQFIVATDRGIFYKMQQLSPKKSFIEAPTGGSSSQCKSCAHCPWMAMNTLENLKQALIDPTDIVEVDVEVARKADIPLNKMLEFAANLVK